MFKKIICACVFLSAAVRGFAQHEMLDRAADSIMAEGKTLYRSEWASWNGTDVFVAKCQQQMQTAGGYFSYETDQNLVNVFFSKASHPTTVAVITFNKDFDSQNYQLDTSARKFTKTEEEYFNLRKAGTDYMATDTIFRSYKNTTLNIVPIIEKDIKRVYVLSGTQQHGVVLFGNDYLITFNKYNHVMFAEKLHKSLIPTNIGGEAQKGGFHSHVLPNQPFITSTDICTLMLYQHLAHWETFTVMSKDYVSNWDCKRQNLVILTMEVWKKIIDDQRERHPDKN